MGNKSIQNVYYVISRCGWQDGEGHNMLAHFSFVEGDNCRGYLAKNALWFMNLSLPSWDPPLGLRIPPAGEPSGPHPAWSKRGASASIRENVRMCHRLLLLSRAESLLFNTGRTATVFDWDTDEIGNGQALERNTNQVFTIADQTVNWRRKDRVHQVFTSMTIILSTRHQACVLNPDYADHCVTWELTSKLIKSELEANIILLTAVMCRIESNRVELNSVTGWSR